MDKIQLCNLAIGFVGGNSIMSFEDETTEAEQCALYYDTAIRVTLESRDWTFAATYRKLVAAPVVEFSEFTNSFQLPADCLAVRIVSDSEDLRSKVEYQKDERRIVSDSDTIFIKYTRNITTTTLFSPTFEIAAAHRLAEYIATKITGDKVLKRALQGEADQLTEDGGAIDGMQGSPKKAFASKLINARYRGGYNYAPYPWGY